MYEGLKEGEGAKETSGYSPVIDWGTLRILLSLTIQYGLHTTQVDFKNAFVQAPLERPMYMNLPPGNKGKFWADRFMACLVAFVTQSTYVDNPSVVTFDQQAW